jgi:hypothetical protein
MRDGVANSNTVTLRNEFRERHFQDRDLQFECRDAKIATMRLLWLLIPLGLMAQENDGTIRGDARWDMKRPIQVVLLNSSGVVASTSAPPNAGFALDHVRPETYLLHVQPQGAGGRVEQVRVAAGRETFVGSVVNSCDEPENGLCDRFTVGEPHRPARVYTVCEALANRDDIAHAQVVIVGILSSGPPKVLRQTCGDTLVTGEFVWPNSITLLSVLEPPPKELQSVIEGKVQDLVSREPGRSRPRRRDVVAFSGRFLAPSGIAKCQQRTGCAGFRSVQLAPAVLSSSTGADFRVFQ